MAKFMLIFHETPGTGYHTFSPAEYQQVFQKYQAWFNRLRESGKHVVSEKLGEEGGKVLSKQKDRIAVVDGSGRSEWLPTKATAIVPSGAGSSGGGSAA